MPQRPSSPRSYAERKLYSTAPDRRSSLVCVTGNTAAHGLAAAARFRHRAGDVRTLDGFRHAPVGTGAHRDTIRLSRFPCPSRTQMPP